MPPLTQQTAAILLQSAVMVALGVSDYSLVRVDWQTMGQPDWLVSADICFIGIVTDDEEYARIQRDIQLSNLDSETIQVTMTYTRGWRGDFVFYGPNATDRARIVHSALFGDIMHDVLAASNLYWVPDTATPIRSPEEFQGQWWERSTFTVRFYEAVTEVSTVSSVESLEVILENASGTVRDFIIT